MLVILVPSCLIEVIYGGGFPLRLGCQRLSEYRYINTKRGDQADQREGLIPGAGRGVGHTPGDLDTRPGEGPGPTADL